MMRLIYRGIAYNYNPQSIATTNVQPVGKYRGWPSQRPVLAPIVTQTSTPALRYRGVRYQAAQPTVAPTIPIPVFPTSPGNRQTAIAVDQVHLAFMRQTLEYRLSKAKAKGDPHLVATLEAEQTQLCRR